MAKRLAVVVALLAAFAGGGLVATHWTNRPPTQTAAASATGRIYQCSMHPQIVQDHPGNCPICQMALSEVATAHKIIGYRNPMRSDVISPTPAKDEMGMEYLPIYDTEEAGSASDVPGHAAFNIPSERQQLIGVTREVVRRRALARDIRAVGTVAYDPTLYQAIVEYREALRAKSEIQRSPWAEAQRGADAIVSSALLKLRQQGISDAQLAQLVRGGNPVNLLLPGTSVWVYAQVYEYELPFVRVGQPITVTAPSSAGSPFQATVVAIDPILSPTTRTARIRALVSTPAADLRPESFVTVTIRVPLGEHPALPESAVLDTGAHQIVFVVKDGGRFEPRTVTLGQEAEGYYEIRSGVAEGEAVVTSANFLIDSESRFRAALAAFRPNAPPAGDPASAR